MAGEMNGQMFQPSNSKIGNIEAKYMVLIAYFGATVLGLIPVIQYVAWLIPLIIYFIDKENKFIAFHAIQAFLLELIVFIVVVIFAIVAAVAAVGAGISAVNLNAYGVGASVGAVLIGGVIVFIVGVVILIFAILSAIRGYKYEIYEVPLVGRLAEKIVFKTN